MKHEGNDVRVPVKVWLEPAVYRRWAAQAERYRTEVGELLATHAGQQIVRTEPRSSGRRLTAGEVQRLYRMVDAGVPRARVAAALGINVTAVRYRLEKRKGQSR